MHNSAFDLAFSREPIEDCPAIMHGDVARDAHVAGDGVDFDLGEVRGKTFPFGILERRIGGGPADQLAGVLNHPFERQLLRRIALYKNLAIAQIQLVGFRF